MAVVVILVLVLVILAGVYYYVNLANTSATDEPVGLEPAIDRVEGDEIRLGHLIDEPVDARR